MPARVFDDELSWLDHDGVIRETASAKLFDMGGSETWIPKSVIEDENDELVGVQRWWAEKNGHDSRWSRA